MKTRIILAGIAILLTAPLAANAADLPQPYKAAPGGYIAPAFSWTGFYVGINGGYGWGDADVSNSFGSFTTGKQNGWLIGGTLGYNYQTGNWVWGLEGDADYALIKGNTSNTLACSSGTCKFEDNWFATARGRIGYAFDRWLPYVTFGGAFAGTKVTPAGGSSSTDTAVGWTAGAGIEYAFLGSWSAKLEYLYADLGKTTCGASVCGISTDIEPKVNLVRLGINYRF
jgi:outer membrane immunogenic protein